MNLLEGAEKHGNKTGAQTGVDKEAHKILQIIEGVKYEG